MPKILGLTIEGLSLIIFGAILKMELGATITFVRELYHLSTMVIHLGHIFISFILMLYGPKLGCVGQARSF